MLKKLVIYSDPNRSEGEERFDPAQKGPLMFTFASLESTPSELVVVVYCNVCTER